MYTEIIPLVGTRFACRVQPVNIDRAGNILDIELLKVSEANLVAT